MNRSLYSERDYAFGQQMLTLRTHIGLTQAGLAKRLGVSRRAVGEWEAGSTYPKVEHLKQLIALGVQLQVFPAGREAEEIRELWKAAHQKVLLDELWLQTLLGAQRPQLAPAVPPPGMQTRAADQAVPRPEPGPRVDWGEALVVPSFYDREEELAGLSQWVVQERCRVVSVLGLGGIGKSALVVTLMYQVAPHFQVVIWRSLRDAPSFEALLEDWLQVLAPQPLREMPTSLERRLGLLLEYLRERRVLLVLDNLEMLLEEEEGTGHMRAGYEDYGRLLRQVAQTRHQSCLLLTSREKPRELVALEGSRTPVRSLRLDGLDAVAGEQLLAEKDVAGTTPEREWLVERYGGNPLALKIVAQTIVDLFGGEIAPFLQQDAIAFGSIAELLGEHFDRLSAVEQTVLLWLAILREPVTIEGLLTVLGKPLLRMQVLEAIEALRRRSLIERGQQRGSFTLQSVVLEYATARLIAEVASEIERGRQSGLTRLIEHSLALASAKEYVRETQQRLIVTPLLAGLRSAYPVRAAVEEQLLALLDQLREGAYYAQGYGPANVLALLCEQRGHLRGLNLSHLYIREAYLQGVEMQDASLAGATLRDTTFTEAFDATWAVAISRNGTSWAAGSRRGEVRVWRQEGKILHLAWHSNTVRALAFSPDGGTLATGSWEGSTELWDLESGALLWTSWHTTSILSLAFAPDGRMLASGADDAVVQLWDAHSGRLLQTLFGQSGPVHALSWSPDGSRLAGGSFDGGMRMWEQPGVQPETVVRMLHGMPGHTNWVTGLAFAPDGRTLASGSFDRTVKLWEVESGRCLQTLTGHTDSVFAVAWSPDGRLLASSGFDQTIWLWDIERGSYRTALHGHTAAVYDLAFTPDGRSLLSGSDDRTVRLWDVESGLCIHIMQGYAVLLYDVAWSPAGSSSSPYLPASQAGLPAPQAGLPVVSVVSVVSVPRTASQTASQTASRQGGSSRLASAGSDALVTLWDVEGLTPPRLLRGHSWIVHGVAWSPDGRFLASCGEDNAVWVWDAITGEARQILRDPDHVDTAFYGVAWSPNGKFLAGASYRQGVQVWEVTTGARRWVGREQLTRIRRVEWSPDGTQLASCGDDGSVCLWEASDGRLRASLQGHRGMVLSVAWSPDGTRLASGGGSSGKGELFVWDVGSGERLYTLSEPDAFVYALAWGLTGTQLLSGSSDGGLRWWDLKRGECVRVRMAHEGAVLSLRRSPDDQRLASCGDDGAINIWDLQSSEHLRTLRRDRPYERLDISGVQGLTDAQRATLRALGAIEEGRGGETSPASLARLKSQR